MKRTGINTGNGYHEDVGLLLVEYTVTGLILGTPVEFDLPVGRKVTDIVGVEFTGKSNIIYHFGIGNNTGDGYRKHCVGIRHTSGTDNGSTIYGVLIETAEVFLTENGNKFTFAVDEGVTMTALHRSDVVSNGVSWGETGDYAFGGADAVRTIKFYFK